MKAFRFRLFVIHCIIYSLMYIVLDQAMTQDGDVILIPLLAIGFISSVMITIIVPSIQDYINKN